MTDRVKRDLTGRINQYVEYRRRQSGKESSFVEALSNKATVSGTKAAKAGPVRSRSSSHAGARVTSGARYASKVASQPASQMPYTKHITRIQALRLANYAPVIQQASRKFGVPVELICAVILQESGGKQSAVSHCGARGLMQLMPATARGLGVSNSNDPVQNIMGGTKYLRQLLDRFGGNMALALAGYNAGEGNVEKYGRRIPPFKETRAYVPNVLKYANTIWGILRRGAPVARATSSRPAIHHRTIYNISNKA